jgi:hypothetical protein
VVSRDGFIKWAWSSEPALKTGRFFRTRQRAVELPAASAAARDAYSDEAKAGTDQPAGVWFDEKCCEMTVRSKRYDLSYTLVHFGAYERSIPLDDEDAGEDTYDRFIAEP